MVCLRVKEKNNLQNSAIGDASVRCYCSSAKMISQPHDIYVGYARSRAAAPDLDLESQRLPIKKYVAGIGGLLADIFSDHGSTDDPNRPGLAALLAYCEAHRGTTVVVTEWARLSRDPVKTTQLVMALDSAGAQLFDSSGRDLLTPHWHSFKQRVLLGSSRDR